jgi:Flp pilus assembly secretin CpaC
MPRPLAKTVAVLALSALALSLAAMPAWAADVATGTEAGSVAPGAAPATPITVKVNMARILRINAPATTVIVGNPGVADVTIQDPKTLVLTGKSYGQTNLIVLDSAGTPIADTLIEVIQSQADLVTVFNSGARSTFSCAPACSPTVVVGDDPTYTGNIVQSIGLVRGNAQ